ncbi:MAG: 2-amino-4-hydroxy-6-hydroxymethyldihydropteridine diphosphokinase [Pseudomonadota bacterium]
MTRIWVSIGSNIERESNIRSALRLVGDRLGPALISPVYESAAEGFDGPAFFNLVTGYDTDLPPEKLLQLFADIENSLGRRRGNKGLSSRPIDIDLLTYGDRVTEVDGRKIPREDILRYGFVLKPLADIAPEDRHPLTGDTFLNLWKRFPGRDQPLDPVDLRLD